MQRMEAVMRASSLLQPMLAVVVLACAPAVAVGQKEDAPRPVQKTTIVIRNDNWANAKVSFVFPSGSLETIGRVEAYTTKSVDISRFVFSQEEIQFKIELFVSHEVYYTMTVLASPGDELRLTMGERLHLTALTVAPRRN
ncbi:MAG: hypothetical protein A3J67_02360 [Parcubacteria group bacterium RIFCSPHIGHO2_02_FULL_48_10b]|nr:MAG: hypothetical protein A3J67_02360 [Parcubacteria group bacterium RIFCSPHIGHO2_02_FULL_48_10b]